jgi:hypothetical protein
MSKSASEGKPRKAYRARLRSERNAKDVGFDGAFGGEGLEEGGDGVLAVDGALSQVFRAKPDDAIDIIEPFRLAGDADRLTLSSYAAKRHRVSVLGAGELAGAVGDGDPVTGRLGRALLELLVGANPGIGGPSVNEQGEVLRSDSARRKRERFNTDS